MQNNYIGDIGDYGKYGLLRNVCAEDLSLAVNWYQVVPAKAGKQEDGKYINYLSDPHRYRDYDPDLFDALHKIVVQEQNRTIPRIEKGDLFPARFFSEPLKKDRAAWHTRALEKTKDAKVVFLDPDNGLESARMHQTNEATEKHVKWDELKDYYDRGQTVILYQHRPQMTAKDLCIYNVMQFQHSYLFADCVKLLEFPKYTNRFYFIFLHRRDKAAFDRICRAVTDNWGKNDFCHEILV